MIVISTNIGVVGKNGGNSINLSDTLNTSILMVKWFTGVNIIYEYDEFY